jgi:broad specificity phosphatase PhoE
MSVRVILVRHGKAAAPWGADLDPGLDETGRAQAARMAAGLAAGAPRDLVVSPLRRTRETAAPLAAAWGLTARLEPRVAEIPSPNLDPESRSAWLRGVMAGRWGTLTPELQAWRASVIAALVGLSRPTVVVSHFIAINVAVGAALDDDRVVVFAPDNCSKTLLDVVRGRLLLVEKGTEAKTKVL